MSLTEMRIAVLKYLDIYAKKQGRTCYVFIDGIDHAARSRMPANDIFLNQIPAVDQINGNVKFILIGQPTNGKYPSWLINEKGKVEIIDLPTLANDDVLLLLENKDINVSGANLDGLANKILQVVGNNALNVLFAIEECKCNDYDYDELINALTERKLDWDISKYYEWILNSLDSSLVLDKLIAVFSYANQKLSKVELSKLCNADVTEVGDYLGKLYPLVQEDEEGFYIFHNDVRLYFKDRICNNRNYNTLVESFAININKDESLTQLKYRYLFDALFDISWKKAIEIYNPEYIIKSTLFNVPVMKLVEQFDLLFFNAYKDKSINEIIKLNLCFNALFQYVNCLEYNNLIDGRFNEQNEILVDSEKYIFDCNNQFEKIIDDIYILTIKGLYSRGEKLFKEYFDKLENEQFISILNNSEYETRLNKLGYILRYYRLDSVLDSISANENLYSKIVSGWLEASQNFLETNEGKISLAIKTCYNFDLYKYVNKIALDIEDEALKFLGDFLSDNNVSIFILIDICYALKLKGHSEISLIDIILQKKDEIITDGTLNIDKYKISYFFKMCFCILGKVDEDNKSELVKLHENLLRDNHIEKGDRGYEAEYRLMEIADKIFKAYKNKKAIDDFGKIIYDMTYFADKYGAGAAHAINSFETIRFLEQIINLLYKEISDEDSRKVACEQLMPIFIGLNNIPANFKKEYISLFRMSNKIEYLKTIAEYWVGKNGVVWGQDYASVEDVSGTLLEELKLCDMVDYADKINKIKSEKIIGYVGHKDYSLYDVLDWFDKTPLSENKFLYGINLLSISDEANNIGDNRASNSIEDALFEVAIKLGWKYVDALFEIHNTVDRFYDWRISLLNALIDSLDYIKYTDNELIEIHKLLNSWIKKDIEIKKTFGSNQMEFLADSNHKIAEKIENQNIRNEYLQIYPKINREQYTHDYSRLDDGVKSEMEDNIKAIVAQEGLSGLAMELLEKYIEKDFSSTYLFLAEIGRDLCQEDKDKYIKRLILPYIIEKNEYGMHGRGLDYLLNEFIGSISVEQYLDILYHAVSRLKNNDPEEFFGINEDFNIIIMSIVKAYHPNDIEKVLSQKINMHQLWITACGDMQLEYYNVSFDENVSTIVDFNKKHLGNI